MSLKSWTSMLDDNLRLTDVAIPGTHDSATYAAGDIGGRLKDVANEISNASLSLGSVARTITRADAAAGALAPDAPVKCQTKTITEQLNLGIRFLDLRISLIGSEFLMFHNFIGLGISLDDVLHQIVEFFEQPESSKETVLISFKQESYDSDPYNFVALLMLKFSDILKNRVYDDCKIPKLKDVRGKAVLLNRVMCAKSGTGGNSDNRREIESGIYLDFDDNRVFSKYVPQLREPPIVLAAQDHYQSLGTPGSQWKIDSIQSGLHEHAHQVPVIERTKVQVPVTEGSDQMREEIVETDIKVLPDLRINFCSATSIPLKYPQGFAEEINPQVRSLLYDYSDGSKSIIVLDFVEEVSNYWQDPIAAIICCNSFRPASDGVGHYLNCGQELRLGQMLISDNGAYRLEFTESGRLAVVQNFDNRTMVDAGTDNSGANRAVFQDDGNFVVYTDANKPIAATGTYKWVGKRMVLQDDGNLVIYDAEKTPIWSTYKDKFLHLDIDYTI